MKVELYVQVVPEWSRWYPDRLDSVSIAKTTKTWPVNVVEGARVVKVVLDVPIEQFVMPVVEVEAPDVPAIRAVS